jgi:hypothetical protein
VVGGHAASSQFNAGGGLTAAVTGEHTAAGTMNSGGGLSAAVTAAHALAAVLNAGGSITVLQSAAHATTAVFNGGGRIIVVLGQLLFIVYQEGGITVTGLSGKTAATAESSRLTLSALSGSLKVGSSS